MAQANVRPPAPQSERMFAQLHSSLPNKCSGRSSKQTNVWGVASWQPLVRLVLPDPDDDLSQAYKVSGGSLIWGRILGATTFPGVSKFPNKKFPRIKFPEIFLRRFPVSPAIARLDMVPFFSLRY